MSQAIAAEAGKQRRLLDGYISEAELATELGKSRRTLRQWRQRREGPPFVKVGDDVYYPVEPFKAWLTSLVQSPVRSRRAA